MSKSLVSDELCAILVPLLPPERPKPKGGRPRIPDRAARTGILFVLKSGIPWEMLPKELGCGSGKTCWRRLRDWQKAGVWQRLHTSFCSDYRLTDTLIGSGLHSIVRVCRLPGGEVTGKDPTNRGKLGAKRHIVVDRNGLPLAVTISGANVHDSKRP
jgi:transposase